MSVGIFGPPVGFSSLQQTPRFSPSIQLEPVSRRRKIEFETDIGGIRLQYRTIQKYLPGLWQLLSNREIHYGHRLTVDPGRVFGLQQRVHQTCISQLFQHLKEMERTDVNSMKLTDWLETLYRRSLHDVDYLSRLTKYFDGLGKVLSPRKLGSHRTLFELMSGFFIKYCRDLFKQLGAEDFLKYMYALDRMHHDMKSVLPMMLQPIGREGRHRLICRALHPVSYFHLLRPATRRAIRKIDQAKKHRNHNQALIFRKYVDNHARMLKFRTPTGWKVAHRSDIPKLKRQFGPRRVMFGGYGPRTHHQLHHVSGLSGYSTPYSPELTPSEVDLSDIDDSSTVLSYQDDEYDLSSHYELGHRSEFEDYHRSIPRRLSYGVVSDEFPHDIQGRRWDSPGNPYYHSELYDDGPIHSGRRGSWYL